MPSPVQLSYVSVDYYAYYNSATFGSKTWARMKHRDMKIGLSYGEGDASQVDNVDEFSEPCMRGREYTWDMLPDETDAVYTALRTAFMTRAPVELAFANGPIGTGGSVASGGTAGVKMSSMTVKIFQFDQARNMKGEVVTSVKAKPAKLAATNAPTDDATIA